MAEDQAQAQPFQEIAQEGTTSRRTATSILLGHGHVANIARRQSADV